MIETFLMESWAGLPIAILVLLGGILLFRSASKRKSKIRSVTGCLAMVLGSVLLLGSAYSISKMQHGISAPGTVVDVGGHSVHVWCEGEKTSSTVIWLPGGYGQALWSYDNHSDIREDTRSCLIDRRGVGWADPGPHEFAPDAIAREVMEAMAAAGEEGPYLLAGHSFGGFYSLNIAALYPDEIVGVVLLDPTAPAWIDYFAYGNCGSGKPQPLYAFASLFGLTWIESLNPLLQDEGLRERMGEWWPAFIAQELRPRTFWSQAGSLSTPCRDILSHVRWPGQLGDTPLLLITQSPEENAEDAMRPESGFRLENYQLFRKNVDQSVMQLSSDTRHLYAPAGAGHDFPHSEPEFTRAQVLEFLSEVNP